MFLEAAPPGTDPDAIGAELAGVPGVAEVHDLHLWEITSGEPALSAHVLVDPSADCHTMREQARILLRERHGLEHTTLQVDRCRWRTLRPACRPRPGLLRGTTRCQLPG